jgi:hypothetical protein
MQLVMPTHLDDNDVIFVLLLLLLSPWRPWLLLVA